MANNNVVNKKLERNTLPTRFLITSNVDGRGVLRDGDDDDPAANVFNDDDNNDDEGDAAAIDTASDDASDDNTDADVAVGFDDDGDSADEDADAPDVDIASDDAVNDGPDADADADAAGFGFLQLCPLRFRLHFLASQICSHRWLLHSRSISHTSPSHLCVLQFCPL